MKKGLVHIYFLRNSHCTKLFGTCAVQIFTVQICVLHRFDVQPKVQMFFSSFCIEIISLQCIVYFLLKQHFSYTLALQPVQFYYYTLLHTTNEQLSTANSICVKLEWKKEKSHTLLNLYILLTCALITCFALLAYAYIGCATLQKAFLL